MRIRPVPHGERRHASAGMRASLAVAVGVLGGTAGGVEFLRRGVDGTVGTAIGIAVVLLLVWGLPSLSFRVTARATVLLSALIIARSASLDPVPGDGIDIVALWLVGAVGVFVFTDRITNSTVPETVDLDAPVRRRRERTRLARSWIASIVFGAIAVLALVIVAPFANERFSSGSEAGAPAGGDGSSAPPTLRHGDELDMAVRPELTDEILMTVRSEHRSFLRAQIFDRWDGSRWTRSETDRYRLAGGMIHTAEHDLGASGSVTFHQRIRLETEWADLYPAAPTAVRLESSAGAVQTLDGTLSAWPQPLGRGAVYTVTSRVQPADPASLRAVTGEAPPAILDRYATAPTTTDRVLELGERIVRDTGADTNYDKIRAFEAWMGDNLEYSIDAPPSPDGADAVDRFLFEDRLGWCEQIASSLVVLARSEGIPARLATGFVASERDRVTGDFVVRAKHAHAWAEVWFPEHGWVPFDPTADVPLAPEADGDRSITDLLRDRLGSIAAVVVGIAVLGWTIGRLSSRWRRHRADRPSGDIARLDRDLARLGARHGIDRGPAESAAAHAARIDHRLGRSDIGPIGGLVDDDLYSSVAPPDEAVAAARRVVAELLRASAPRRGRSGRGPGDRTGAAGSRTSR